MLKKTIEPLELLKSRFGYDGFWPLQEEIIETVVAGRDCLALMPTGGGKSLCYQLPALMFPGDYACGVAAYCVDEGPG